MIQETLEGIVLKKIPHTDRKCLTTLFTDKKGLILASVPIHSKHPHALGAFEPGHVLLLEITEKKQFIKVKEFAVISAPYALRDSLEKIKAFSSLLIELSNLLPEYTALPPFYAFLKKALTAFEHTKEPSALKNFILLKWLQIEGILDKKALNPFQDEVEILLKIRTFREIPSLSKELKDAIALEIRQY